VRSDQTLVEDAGHVEIGHVDPQLARRTDPA
jgi:hypothetical protein